MSQAEHSPLGKATSYADEYDASLLYPISRSPKRAEIGVSAQSQFLGADLWTAYELGWLNLRGKPQIAIAALTVPCETPNIVESKSLKLYLNSFNQSRFADALAVQTRIRADLAEVLWRESGQSGSIGVKLITPDLFDRQAVQEFDGLDLDRLDIECTRFTPAPDFLQTSQDEARVSEVLTSRLLKSNCLFTGQPDWASVQISYTGAPINQEGLLQYLVSFRQHNEFHEQCVERIFMDLWTRCQPLKLAVYARYTRRGGLDINPFRTSYPQALPANLRHARQ
jgi:7-cyano-7-deazaguanine reductase